MIAIYNVQSFSAIKGGIRSDIPTQWGDEESAMKAAVRLAEGCAGVIVMMTTVNDYGDVAGVELLKVFGDLPDYVIEGLVDGLTA